MSRWRPNPSVPISLLTVLLVLFIVTVAQAQVCHDNIWSASEFCGHDALVVTGDAEMNHDCMVDFLDLILFASEFGSIGWNLSADLNHDAIVDIFDLSMFAPSFYSGHPVIPCNPSPHTPNNCEGNLSLSLDMNSIVSRGRLASPGPVTVYVIASGWVDARAIEFAFTTTPNVVLDREMSPAGWSVEDVIHDGVDYYCWDGTINIESGTTVVAQYEFIITDINPASIELVDYGVWPGRLTRWTPMNLDSRNEFQVRRNIGINTADPVSTSGCLGPNASPTLAITDPASNIQVTSTSYLVEGSAVDTDGAIDIVEVRVDDGPWQRALGTDSWSASVDLVMGENWIQVRTVDDLGAYSSTQVVTIERLAGYCHDFVWPDGEFCGHDAYVVTGETEMNHDCVLDFLDLLMFYSEFALTGPELSADFNDDNMVDVIDFQIFVISYGSGNPVVPCNPSPPTPDYCDASLSLSLDPNIIVSRGRLASPGPMTVYVVASGWSNAGAIEYAFVTSSNVLVGDETSPVGWNMLYSIIDDVNYFCWSGIGLPVTGTTVVVQHDVFITDTQLAYLELVDYGTSPDLLTRWVPSTLDSRNEFQVRRNVGINTADPVSTPGCLGPNSSPTLAITDPSSDIQVTSAGYVVAGSATDTDGTINFVEYRVNDGPWSAATGLNSWTASVSLVLGENWIQVRTADDLGAYSSTQVVTIERVEQPDLTVTGWSAPGTLLAGCLPTNVSVTVQNDSDTDAPACRLGFYLSTDSVIDASDYLLDTFSVPALLAYNSTIINTVVYVSDEGPREEAFLGAFVDDLDEVIESNEDNNTISSSLEYPIPALDSVVDVENDQGRIVRLNVLASSRDIAGSTTPILQYEAFRRIDPLPPGAARGPAPVVEGTRISDPLKLAGWEFVGAVPAHGHFEYNMIVPTLADSNDEATHNSIFFVRAATVQPLVFFDSCPDSGCSVDNLPPSVPEGLLVAYAAGGNQLSWEPCPETDFRYFRIYGGSSLDFVPDVDNLIEATTDIEWLDTSSDPWSHYYKISAVDRNGNESEIASPAEVTGVQGSAVPTRTALLNAVPNPFNPSTKLPFEMAAAGHARLKVYDTAGRLVATLVDEHRAAGIHYVIWDGRDDAGRMSSAGVYLYRFEVGEFSEAKRMVLVK